MIRLKYAVCFIVCMKSIKRLNVFFICTKPERERINSTPNKQTKQYNEALDNLMVSFDSSVVYVDKNSLGNCTPNKFKGNFFPIVIDIV